MGRSTSCRWLLLADSYHVFKIEHEHRRLTEAMFQAVVSDIVARLE